VMTRSGSLVDASAAPELPRSQPATARHHPSHPKRFVGASVMTAPRTATDFAPKSTEGTQPRAKLTGAGKMHRIAGMPPHDTSSRKRLSNLLLTFGNALPPPDSAGRARDSRC